MRRLMNSNVTLGRRHCRLAWRKAAWSVLIAPGILPLLAAPARAAPLFSESGAVLIEQIDFRGGPNAGVADFTINYDAARGTTGFSEGYVNVSDVNGNWVVRNLPVLSPSQADISSLTTRLDLGIPDGIPLSDIVLSVDYSLLPSFSPPPLIFGTYPLSKTTVAIGNVGTEPLSPYLPHPIWATVLFDPAGPTFGLFLPGFTNIQAADNQCAPASVANSLGWLHDTQNVPVPHPNRKGLRSDAPSGGDDPNDPSLVGELEKDMNRGVRSRSDGDGVWPLDGKLKYVADNNLNDDIVVNHQGGGGTGGNPSSDLDGTSDLTRHGITSHGQGGAVTWDWIYNELAHGEDVEMDIHFAGGGRHYVRVVGAGKILGRPFVLHISDHDQSDTDTDDPNTPQDETDTRGTDKVDFGYMDESDIMHPELPTWDGEIDQAISESKRPVVHGDLNCDGTVDFKDINPFVLYLSNLSAWEAANPDCPPQNGDINGDGTYPSFGDINPFVALLSGGGLN